MYRLKAEGVKTREARRSRRGVFGANEGVSAEEKKNAELMVEPDEKKIPDDNDPDGGPR